MNTTEIVRPADSWTVEALTAFVRRESSDLTSEIIRLSAAMKSTAERAWNIGLALCILKDRAGHKNWLTWLSSNLPEIGKHNAQRYMRIYTHWANATDVSHLNFGKALRMVQVASLEPSARPSACASGQPPARLPGTDYEPPPEPISPTAESDARDVIETILLKLSLNDINTLVARRIMAGIGDSEITKELMRTASEVPAIHERIKAVATEIGIG